jgi:hypothetical protein
MSQKSLPETEIPEVAAFTEVQRKLNSLKEAYPEVFEHLDSLKEEYNAALEAADKAVRGRRVSCGPFVMYQTQTKYDAEKLYDAVGRDRFLEVGGKMSTITTYEVDRAKLEAHIAAGTIDTETVGSVREVSPRYRKPEKLAV